MLWKKEIETKKLPDNCRLYTYISSARRGSLMHWKYDVHNISFIHFLKEEKIDHLYWYKQKKSLKNQLPKLPIRNYIERDGGLHIEQLFQIVT